MASPRKIVVNSRACGNNWTQGEAEAILVDEQRGRRVAAEHGLAVMGLLGVLARAISFGVGENPLPPFAQDVS